jgi:glycosyltransferase involved in cell wall biosynthesis
MSHAVEKLAMNLLAISETFWPEGGGAELATYLVLKILAESGFNVSVLTGSLNAKRPHPSVQIIKTEKLLAKSKTELWIKLLLHTGTFKKIVSQYDIIYLPRYSFPIIPLAKKLNKKVVVHLHDYIPISYTAAIPAPYEDYRFNLKLIDGFNVWLESKKGAVHKTVSTLGSIYTHLTKEWLIHADIIICVSNRHAEITKDLAPQLKNKIEVIYNPPPLININKNANNILPFLYVGGDSYAKGFHIFLKSTINLLRKGYKVKFTVTKNISRKNKGVFQLLNKKFSNAYEIKGFVKHNKLLDLYSKALALIFPSIWEEPLPYVIVESMLTGTIPIASKVGGVPEIISGTYAEKMLFKPGDANELVDKLEEVLSLSKEQLYNIGESLRNVVLKNLDSEKIKRGIHRVFV